MQKTVHRLNLFDTKLVVCLMTCPIPASHRNKSPVAVSLVEHGCDNATNHLRVIHNKLEEGSDKKLFAVCSKGHTFPDEDKSVEIVEWIEIIRSMGADIFMYHFDIHPNITKVNLKFDPKSLNIILLFPRCWITTATKIMLMSLMSQFLVLTLIFPFFSFNT